VRPGVRRGLIAPHAGWTYSGDCAGRGYRELAGSAPSDIDLVVVFGSHRGPTGPNTVFVQDAWDTPLGPLKTELALAVETRRALSFAEEPVELSGRPDNAVELQLPFIRYFWPQARLLMLGVEASASAIEIGREVGERVRAGGHQAVFVGSTDLTHYGDNYGWAPRGGGPEALRWVREVNDAGFIDAVLRDDPARAVQHALDHRSACCPGATVAAMEAARAYAGALTPELVDHYTSHDVRPSPSFVGYASLVL